MRYSTAIHTRDEAWVWIQDPKKITDFKGVFLVKEFRGISSTAGDLFEIKTNLKPFFGGVGKATTLARVSPGFKLNSRSHPEVAAFELASSEGLQTSVPWPWGRKESWHGIPNIWRWNQRYPFSPQKKKYVMWQRTTEKESWMKMSISPIKNGDILASHVHFSGWYHWNAAVWNPSIRDLAGRCSDAISWWRILAQSELKLRGDPSEMPWKNINVSHWYLLEISQSQYAYS